MAIISECPKCEGVVTIPDGVDPDATVRCPLCEAEYPLSEALAAAPPALIPVEIPAAGGRGEAPETAAAAVEQAPDLDVWKKVDEVPEFDLEGSAAPGGGVESFTGFDVQPAAEQAESAVEPAIEPAAEPAAAPAAKPRPRRKRKSKSAMRQMIEAVVGGFAGLLIGYYLLCWFGGSRVDLPKLPLPFLPHTMKKPADADQPAAAKPDAGSQKPAAAKPEQPKPRPKQQPADNVAPSQPPASPDGPPVAEPKPKPLPDDYVGPRNPPSFTSADLGKALKAAHEAIHGQDASGEMTAAAYGKFRHLAHVLTFVEPGSQLADRKQAVKDMLRDIAADQAQIEEVGRLAAGVLEDTQGPNGGILLAGAAGKIVRQKGLYATAIRLAGHTMSVVVMSNRPLPFDEQSPVLLLGSIIDKPAENLAGYGGTKPFLVWVGTAAPVPAAP